MFKKIQQGAVILGLLLPLTSQALSCRGISKDDPSFAACDASFINPPFFGDLCLLDTLTATYTLRNNTPVTFRINYIRIQNNDGLSAASVVVPSPTNSCGSSLAAGATCNISVQLSSGIAVGTLNRVLQVGINTRQVQIDAPAITSAVGSCDTPGPIPAGLIPTIPGTPLSLFQASILGASTVTNSGFTVVNGDLDLTPGSSVTGFPPGVVTNGAININNAASTLTKAQATAYFGALNALPCNFSFGPGDTVITQVMLNTNGPGVYCFASSAQIVSGLNIAGALGQSYTFKIASTLTTAVGTTMTKSGGISNDNINWAVGSSATINGSSTILGIIVANISISLGTGAILNGRAWALNGAVTLLSNMVNPTAP